MKIGNIYSSSIMDTLPAAGGNCLCVCGAPAAVSCLMLLLLCILTSPAIAESSPTPPDVNAPAPSELKAYQADDTANAPGTLAGHKASDWLIAKPPKMELARTIWRERMTVPQSTEPSNAKDQLQQLIDRIRSIEFKPKEQAHQPVVVVEHIPPQEPNTTPSATSDQRQIEAQENPAESQGAVSGETLKILAEQLKRPDLLKNPFELGEILFSAGRPKEAAVCYRQALAKIDPNQPDTTDRIPWALFQIGNCLRKEDPAQALEAYSQLITEHAGSMWVGLAKAQSSIIAWCQQDKPRTLIEENRPKTTDNVATPKFIIETESESDTEQKKGG